MEEEEATRKILDDETDSMIMGKERYTEARTSRTTGIKYTDGV